jgi:3-dehydroquinate synthase
MKNKNILVRSSVGAYRVVCGAGAVAELRVEIERLGKFSSVQVVSSRRVWRAVGRKFTGALGGNGAKNLHLFDDGEPAKNMRTVEALCRALTRGGVDRKALIVAVGGGVVGDVAGFVAASYLRGVGLVHVPTTVVAQVDSAIGGKTGVNLPEGKNLVGAFYAPRLVMTDYELLRSLPEREYRSGLAEVVKYGVIADARFFAFLEKNVAKVLRRDRGALEYLIPRCAAIKAAVVSKDEREAGLREILNYGHTFGHALESVTKYRRYKHGEAVAWGMMMAARLGWEIGVMKDADASRVIGLCDAMVKLPEWPRVGAGVLIRAMRADKKTHAGKLRFVLSERIGKARTYERVPLSAVENVLRSGRGVLAMSEGLDA